MFGTVCRISAWASVMCTGSALVMCFGSHCWFPLQIPADLSGILSVTAAVPLLKTEN